MDEAGDSFSAYLEMVDPDLREAALRSREFTASFLPITPEKLVLRRSLVDAMIVEPRGDVPFYAQRIPERAGLPGVVAYVINAAPGAARPGIVHMHGGGFTASSARASVRSLQGLALDLQCVIIAVEYRLAPETTYEGVREDNYAALLWTCEHAVELGLDPRRIALMGESAGGGHAAVLAILARDRGEVSVMFQALTYPMLDDRTGTSRPVPAHIGVFGWNAEANRFGWGAYLGREPGGEDAPAGAVPARVEDLRGLPPAFIGVGALDLFVRENIDYARRLIEAGIPTELVVAPGAPHGFDMVAGEAAVSKRFASARLSALRRAFDAAGG